MVDINDQLMLKLFQEQKDHIDTRFTEVKIKIKDIKDDVCDLKNNRKRQLIIAGISGLFGGAAVMILHCMTGGKIFDAIKFLVP